MHCSAIIRNDYLFYRGVMQALVEKHFPVINKNKVNEVVELVGSTRDFEALLNSTSQPGPSTSSSGKRKPGKH